VSPVLDWKDGLAADGEELRQFVCSQPPPKAWKSKHRKLLGARWEREVQSGIRDLRPPMPPGDTLLIGRDLEGIAAVSWWFDQDGPGLVKLLAGAVALRCRRVPGLRLGDELMDETLSRIAERASEAGLDHAMVWGYVHRMNGPSQAMVERHGFFYVSDDDEYQEWWLRVDIAD
jgi:ribosomal protein S18 acetylase RimI-like enzyme